MVQNCHIRFNDLTGYLKDLFGAEYEISRITNMHGGAQKVVYKIECSNGFACMLFVWDDAMDYFQEEKRKGEVVDETSEAELFELNNKYLLKCGIRTPSVYYMNKDRKAYPFDFAIVECISGGSLESYFHADRETRGRVLSNFNELLRKMHSIKRDYYGKAHDKRANKGTCESIIFDRSVECLSYSSGHLEHIANNRHRIDERLSELFERIKPRDDYAFIHGELGPDHVLVDSNLQTYLIDIEGVEYFDIEYEHSFLQFRFGDHYRFLANAELDMDRMLFYKLHHHISCTAGGLKLLHRGFPNQKLAREIFTYNAEATLKFLK